MRIPINKDELIEDYINNKKSTREISKKHGVSQGKIMYYIKKYKIKTRHCGYTRKPENLIGKSFRNFTIINSFGKDKNGFYLVEIKCNCGETRIVRSVKVKKPDKYKLNCKKCYIKPFRPHPKKGIKRTNFIGKKFGIFKVIDMKNLKYIIKCKCGNIKSISDSQLLSKKTKNCMNCIKIPKKLKNGYSLIHKCKWFENIPARYYNNIKTRAKNKNKIFTVSIRDLNEQFKKQNGRCRFSNQPLFFRKQKGQQQNASLDRIDSTKGYEAGNIQWVTKQINSMKWNLSDNDFINLCKQISNHS